jgi:hypothetical protein
MVFSAAAKALSWSSLCISPQCWQLQCRQNNKRVCPSAMLSRQPYQHKGFAASTQGTPSQQKGSTASTQGAWHQASTSQLKASHPSVTTHQIRFGNLIWQIEFPLCGLRMIIKPQRADTDISGYSQWWNSMWSCGQILIRVSLSQNFVSPLAQSDCQFSKFQVRTWAAFFLRRGLPASDAAFDAGLGTNWSPADPGELMLLQGCNGFCIYQLRKS